MVVLTAISSERGLVDATRQPDLGCGWSWSAVHRARPRVPLACPVCGHRVHAKESGTTGTRYFAHDRGGPVCSLAGETMEHRLLKLQLASAIRAAGAHAELEVAGPTGAWRADVLATTADGRVRMAWEAQLASITPADIARRTEAMAADGVAVCWVAVGSERWLAHVPAIRVQPPAERAGDWSLLNGLFRLVPQKPTGGLPPICWVQVRVGLNDFVAWVLQARVVERRFTPARTFWLGGWTAPVYLAEAESFLSAER